jgi:hydrogenase maturation protease
VGNRLRGDDGAGPAVASALGARTVAGEPLALLHAWDGADAVVLVDAVRTGAPPGTIHRFDASEAPLPAELGGAASTHALGIGEAIELARALGRLPARVIVVGIEGERFELGDELSAAVAGVVGEAAARVRGELGALAARR